MRAFLLLLMSGVLGAAPVRVIFDTDITGDVDDVLALAMLHALADRGACEILGITISKVNPLTGPFTDAVNTFYGRPDLPIGITRKAEVRPSKYLGLANQGFAHDLPSNDVTPEAVDLLRKILAAQPDGQTVIVQVGLAVNVARLLASGPDRHSPLSGVDLVKKKVKLLSVMAGDFRQGSDLPRRPEANVKNDIASMKDLVRLWPTEIPIVWSGHEIGVAATYPRESIAKDFGYVPRHIVREAYLLHSGPEHDRPTWDLTSVLYAVWPDRGYFDLSAPGRVAVEDDGYTRFDRGRGGRDRYLVMNTLKAARVREASAHLASQPPRPR